MGQFESMIIGVAGMEYNAWLLVGVINALFTLIKKIYITVTFCFDFLLE